MKIFKILAIILLLLAVTLVGGDWVWRKYQDHLFISDVTPLVKNTTLRLVNCLTDELDESGVITYKELLEKLEDNISEAGKSLLAIQTKAMEPQRDRSTRIEAYVRGAQELQRAVLLKYRKLLAVRSALERAKISVEEMKSSTRYTIELHQRMAERALEEAKAGQQEHNQSIRDVAKFAEKMKGLATGIANLFPKDAVIDPSVLDAVFQANQSESSSTETPK